MLFTKLALLMSLSIFFLREIAISEGQKRDDCCDRWNRRLNDRNREVTNILKKFLTKYEVDLNVLQKLTEILSTRIKNVETDLPKLGITLGHLKNNTSKLSGDLKNLQKNISLVQEELKKIGHVGSVEDVTNALRGIKEAIAKILQILNNMSFDGQIDLVDGNIVQRLEEIKNNFPVIHNSSLNVIFSLETDIELLESNLEIQGNYTDASGFNKKLNDSTKWIENELLSLLEKLNNTLSFDIDGLQQNVSNAKTSAEGNDDLLDDLLKKHNEFNRTTKQLEGELVFYNRLKGFVDDLQEFNEEVNMLLKILKRKIELRKYLNDLEREVNAYEMKEQSVLRFKDELEQLWKEQREVVQEVENYQHLLPLLTDGKRIKAKIEEALGVIGNLTFHCSSGDCKMDAKSENMMPG